MWGKSEELEVGMVFKSGYFLPFSKIENRPTRWNMPTAGANFEVIIQQKLRDNKTLALNMALGFVSDPSKPF